MILGITLKSQDLKLNPEKYGMSLMLMPKRKRDEIKRNITQS